MNEVSDGSDPPSSACRRRLLLPDPDLSNRGSIRDICRGGFSRPPNEGMSMKTLTTANHYCSPVTFATFDASVKRAFSSQSTLIDRGEHCSLDPERLASIGRVPGSQIRVVRSSEEFALYTVSETRQESIDITVRMALSARQRLGTSDEFEATIDARVPHPTFSDEEAQANSEFVERLDDGFGQQALVAIAPHGGAIERHTDDQAERVAAILGCERVT